MSKHQRIARIESIDLSTGVFPMTLATEGEASDGHILSIKGGSIPEKMPLLSSHWNDPADQLGSITEPQKALKDSPPRLRATGRIEMDGPRSEVRRDLAHMISKGHVNAVSIRWDEVPGKSIRRINLPSNHPYFVDAEKETGPARWGIFFEEWRALEGSVVALGADPGALIGRAEETTGEVSAFWRSMAASADPPPEVEIEMELDPPYDAKQAAALAALRVDVEMCRALGLDEELAEVIGSDIPSGPEDDSSEPERTEVGLEPEPDQEPEPEVRADQPSPLTLDIADIRSPIDFQALGELMANAVDEFEKRVNRNVQALFDLYTGKVPK